jgi:hypothetical protein
MESPPTVTLAAHWTPTTTLLVCSVPAVISVLALSILARDRFGITELAPRFA